MNDLDAKFNEAIAKLIGQNRLAGEELTGNQLASAMRQALACGDFIKYVRVTDDAQAAVYLPFANQELLKARINELEEKLKLHGITPDKDEHAR